MERSLLGMSGKLGAQLHRGAQHRLAPVSWHIKNRTRWSFWKGWLGWHFFAPLARQFNVLTGMGRLSIVHRHADGSITDYGIVSYNVVTSAGVGFLVDDWDDDTTDITTMAYHGCGTGSTAENASDTALVTESTTALNPDSTRATGTATQPSANVLQSVGTLTFDDAAAVVEHGLLSQAATGGGVLWDRSVFAAINVVSGDSITFTYQCTLTAGS